jgi:RNA polymerase sigma-70 factor, ECF subfamily
LRTFNSVYNVGVKADLRDPDAFRRAFNDHHRAVYTAAFRIVNDATLAQDVVQDVFLRLWRRPGSFNPERGDLGTYLRLMGRSRALDLWREGQVRGRTAERVRTVFAVGETEDPPALVERDSESAAVRRALGKLPAVQREALVLAYWGGLTADQIARREHVPLGTAKSRIRLGLARLRQECPALALDAA